MTDPSLPKSTLGTTSPLLQSQQSTAPWLTLVVPTYNERENVHHILRGLEQSEVAGAIAQIIFVDDDSPDGTAEAIRSTNSQFPIICLHRIGRSGLSSAVIEGMLAASSPAIAVMDADGQHTASDLAAMAARFRAESLHLIIGSRFLTTDRQPSHMGLRHRISQWGNAMARAMLGRPIADPLTGFFLISRSALMPIARDLKPIGFKILFDILYLIRGRELRVAEHQIGFARRHAGESKLDAAVLIEFIDQIAHRLSRGLIPEKFLSFGAVGGSGVAIHFLALYPLLQTGSIPFWLAQATATLAAMTWNYSLNNEITFRRMRRTGARWLSGLALFVAFCSVGALANVGIASALFEQDYSWWLSGLAGVIVGTVFNFSLSRSYVWKR